MNPVNHRIIAVAYPKDKRITAITAQKLIIPRTAIEGVIVCSAIQMIVTGAPA